MAQQHWLVVTGAASGIMEAGHVGAGRENSMGLNIMLPFEQYANPIIAGDAKLVHMKYFFTRKLMFVKECDAVCLLPGGFGTLDEGLEVLTLLQTGKRDMVPVVFLDAPGGNFWSDVHRVRRSPPAGRQVDLAGRPFAVQDDRQRRRARCTRSCSSSASYHSMRVREEQARAAAHAPADAGTAPATSTPSFRDILSGGEFEVSGPLPRRARRAGAEALPRLVFRFNRRSLGRLRQLIDLLNAGPTEEVAACLRSTKSPPAASCPPAPIAAAAGESSGLFPLPNHPSPPATGANDPGSMVE